MTDGRFKAVFLISRVIKGTKIGQEIRDALGGYDLPVLDTTITQRVVFPSSAAIGSTVLDDEPDGTAAAEIQALCAEVLALCR